MPNGQTPKEKLIAQITKQSSTPGSRDPATQLRAIEAIRRRRGGSGATQERVSSLRDSVRRAEEARLRSSKIRDLSRNVNLEVARLRSGLASRIRTFTNRNQILQARKAVDNEINRIKSNFALRTQQAKGLGLGALQKFDTGIKAAKAEIPKAREFVRERGIKKSFTQILAETEKRRAKGLTKPPSKETALAIAVLPLFTAAAAARGVPRGATAVARQKSFSEIAREQLAGLESRFGRLSIPARSEAGKQIRIGLRNDLRRLVEAAKGNPERIKALRQLSKRLGGTEGQRILDDIIAQEISVPVPSVIRPTKIPRKVTGVLGDITGSPLAVREAERIARLPRIVGGEGKSPSADAGTGQFERTDFVALNNARQKLGLPENFGRGSKLVENTILKAAAGQVTLSSQAIKPAERLAQPELLAQPSATSQGARLDQRTRQRQRQRLAQLLALSLGQRYKQAQQQRGRGRRLGGRPRFPRRFRRGFPLLPSTSEMIRRGIIIPSEVTGRQKFDIFVRKGGKLIRINKKPLRMKSARDLGAENIDRTLRASFELKPTTREGLGKIKPSIKGSFSRNRNELRPSKNPKTPNSIVEKRKFRLDSRTERVRIQQIKKLKKPFSKRVR